MIRPVGWTCLAWLKQGSLGAPPLSLPINVHLHPYQKQEKHKLYSKLYSNPHWKPELMPVHANTWAQQQPRQWHCLWLSLHRSHHGHPQSPDTPVPHTPSTAILHSTHWAQGMGQTLFGVNLFLSSGHLFPYQLGSLTPQAHGRLGTALSEFYVQLHLLITQISYYKNKKKQ